MSSIITTIILLGLLADGGGVGVGVGGGGRGGVVGRVVGVGVGVVGVGVGEWGRGCGGGGGCGNNTPDISRGVQHSWYIQLIIEVIVALDNGSMHSTEHRYLHYRRYVIHSRDPIKQ